MFRLDWLLKTELMLLKALKMNRILGLQVLIVILQT